MGDLINPITGKLNNPSNDDKDDEQKDKNDDDGDENKEDVNHDNDVDMDGNDENEQNEVMEVKKKTKYKRRLLKSKPLRQNILNIIDKQKFVLHGVQSQKENDKKMIYSVSLRSDENEIEMKEDANEYEVDLSDNIHGNHFEAKQVVQNEENKNTMDAPHRDWSVLAKHLKDSSKEQARRKQILKQLERILHVREGLIVGFDQLKQIYSKQQNSKIGQNK